MISSSETLKSYWLKLMCYVLPCRIWSFCVKGCRHKYGTAKIGKLSWGGRHGCSNIHVCYRVKFSSSAIKGEHIHRREPQNWGCWDPAPWGVGITNPVETSPLPTWCHIKFDSSATKGVRINRREPQKLWSAGAPPHAVGAWLTL